MGLYHPEVVQVLQYLQDRYSAEPEFLWAKTPNNAVFRHTANKKWFAALLLDMPREKLGLDGGRQAVDILDLKCDPNLIGSFLNGTCYLPGYHMNKEHWITVVLDGSAPADEVFRLIDLSYEITKVK